MSDEQKYMLQALQGEVAKVADKQDKVLDIVSEQNEILARMQVIQEQHHASLEEHHRRTTASEDRLLLLERKDHQFQAFVKGAAWVLGGASSLAAIAKYFSLI